MNTTEIQILGKNDRGYFAGLAERGDYVVFSDLTGNVQLGHTLSAEDWETVGPETVLNVTAGDEADICLEDWGCSKAKAQADLGRLGNPTKVQWLG